MSGVVKHIFCFLPVQSVVVPTPKAARSTRSGQQVWGNSPKCALCAVPEAVQCDRGPTVRASPAVIVHPMGSEMRTGDAS